jgi:hypothetical protein
LYNLIITYPTKSMFHLWILRNFKYNFSVSFPSLLKFLIRIWIVLPVGAERRIFTGFKQNCKFRDMDKNYKPLYTHRNKYVFILYTSFSSPLFLFLPIIDVNHKRKSISCNEFLWKTQIIVYTQQLREIVEIKRLK